MSLNQSFISDFSEYYRWSQRTKTKYKLHYGWCTGRLHFEKSPFKKNLIEMLSFEHMNLVAENFIFI